MVIKYTVKLDPIIRASAFAAETP